MRTLFLIAFVVSVAVSKAQSSTEQEIRQLLARQTVYWNNGDLENFMSGYWKNDSLVFIGKENVVYGYEATLERYRKAYPDTASMGRLAFDIIQVRRISDEYYWVLGKWTLTRKKDKPSGHYTLLFRRLDNKWMIVADHSS